MPPSGRTRQRMIATAAELFRRQGFHATGMNQLLAESQAPKGSLYFHFPGGKQQLAAEAVAASAADVAELLSDVMAQAESAPQALRAVTDMFATALIDSDFHSGCPLATVALDVAADSEPVREACREGYSDWVELLARRLRADGLGERRAEALAITTVSAIEGALLLARVRRDVAPLWQVCEQLCDVLESTTAH